MRNEILAAGVVLVATLAAVSPAAASVTFEQAKFIGNADAYARHDADMVTLVADALPAAPLVQNRSAYASAHGSSARAQGSASFTDVANGEVNFTEVYAGSKWFNEQPSGADASIALRYTFTVDRSYLLRFTYDLAFDPHTDVNFYLFQDGDIITGADFDAGQGYLFSQAFDPGTYTLHITATSFAKSSPDLKQEYNTVTGKVGFTLLPNGRVPTSPTPEPAIWALMIGGFGMAGVGLRRRRALA